MYLQTNLNHLRNLYNLSFRQLGKEAKVNFKNIYNLETGLTDIDKITFGTIYRLASYFNISLDDFVFKDLSQTDKVSLGDTERKINNDQEKSNS